MKKYFFFLLFFFSFIACQTENSANKIKFGKIDNNLILGAWEMQEVHWIGNDTTYSMPNAQPGIFIFTENNYSIAWTPTDEPRIPFDTLSRPSNEEIIAGFKSVVFNAGTYFSTDSTITATASIAKVPGFEGGKQFYSYTIKGDVLNLTMVDETYPDGSKPQWSGKWKTLFVMKRSTNNNN